MKRSTMFLCAALVMAAAWSSFAIEPPTLIRATGAAPELVANGHGLAKAARDTVVLIGSWNENPQVNGQFQDANGLPAWNGWTHYDVTQPTSTHWNISDYHADNLGATPQAGNLAAWCGDIEIAACNDDDPVGGYGNNWNDIMEFFATVADPSASVSVTFAAYANFHSEPGYDGTTIKYQTANGWQQIVHYDGQQANVAISEQFTVATEDYTGTGNDQVHIVIQFKSDGGWSDADCHYATAGAVQIDDITVTLNQGGDDVVSFTDFENGWGDWATGLPDGVGDFTKLWSNLEEIDPCATNYSPQVAFIDDGEVVPGAGPSLCIDWCYGPGGYIVNTTGGLAGPDAHLQDMLISPVMEWPQGGYEGAYLRFDVYRHETLAADSPGIFYMFGIRSTASDDPADLQNAEWVDRNGVYYGGPDYFRDHKVLSDLVVAGAKYIQIQLTCREAGYIWNIVGNNGYPAPYFDNVRFIAYPRTGPAISVDQLDLAQDNFPAIGEVMLNDLGLNSVRFDMAKNISPANHNRNDPGDSIVLDIKPGRAGAAFVGDPELHWVMQQNALFNEYRTNAEYGAASSGVKVGVQAVNSSGNVVEGKWAFDLPDSNFLFPGDILHYYITATDAVDGADQQTTTLPVKLDGYEDFSGPLAYYSAFTVRALPSVYDDPLNPGTLVTPKTLFWNDFADRGGEAEWLGALDNLGFKCGKTYDIYYTNRPDAGDGNGLGGRATVYSITNYENMLYTSGDLTVATISNGDFNMDAGNDVELLDSWLRLGNKGLFLTGDALVSDLINSGTTTVQFVENWMKVTHVTGAVRPLLNNQATPLVKAVAGNGVFLDDQSWIAYGGCPIINNFDAVTVDADNGGVRLAEFTSPNGAVGAYTYSAATYYHDEATGSKVVSMPYDFMSIYSPVGSGKANASLPARARVLEKVLALFGVEGDPLDVTHVPGLRQLGLKNYPNPFNPTTRIEYTMPKAGHLSLKVYSVRGELVKTLIDEHIESSGSIMWDGTDDHGSRVGSGIYFYEARTAGQVKVRKMALVK